MALFPEDRVATDMEAVSTARLKWGALLVDRLRQWGVCWLALPFWKDLQLAQFRVWRLELSRSVLQNPAAGQMLNVHMLSSDSRTLASSDSRGIDMEEARMTRT